MELNCVAQNYAWGKMGSSSAVATLKASADPGFKIAEDQPYAELWMGTHPNGPSKIKESGQDLKEFVQANPTVLGQASRQVFGDDLPFLFKVLSVNKALSIQAHPNKKHAEELFAQRPNIYKDPNHKPEMAIALTKFEGLCGFRPLEEIQAYVKSIPELEAVIGPEKASLLVTATKDDYTEALKAAFTALMSCDKALLASNLSKLLSKIKDQVSTNETESLFIRLMDQYPGDVGCFVIFFVNYVKLDPGQAMFLGSNLIHAYLSGDCVECMACSDNVVRAGLTPKLIDVPTLCQMLEYVCKTPSEVKFEPVSESTVSTLYNPPVPDFAVAMIDIPAKEKGSIQARSSASILLVVIGTGSLEQTGKLQLALTKGSVVFVEANQEIKLENQESQPLTIFQAFC